MSTTPRSSAAYLTGPRLRLARQTLGYTQLQLARKLGLRGHAAIAQKEAGSRDISRGDELAIECLLRRAGLWRDGWDGTLTND